MTIELRQFDPSRHLDSEEAIALYLEAILDEDPDMLAAALGDVARARGMTELAEKTGLARESLYQALSENGNPTYNTIRKVLDAFGVRISIKPQHEPVPAAVY
jgi:probable addiction module antidote protein